ncbi:MAG TPA: DUF885 domain-containing protein [Bryobacteraceae bacterium]|nr:DUF885 domain-containing protein [Bryobacteraceae bacterium]
MNNRVPAAAAALLLLAPLVHAQQTNIDDFFRNFTAEWVRSNPNLATSSRYFSGEEQDRLERQLTPETLAYRRSRIELARRGQAELAKFDRSKLNETQRVSTELMQWQLDTVVREEPFLDYSFPLQQMSGANINLVEALTVRHPLASEKDAVNYLAALGQVGTRMDEATAESRRLAAKNVIPPKFILQATIKQMSSFVDQPAAQNPFAAIFSQKLDAIKDLSPARRTELRGEAAKIVETQVYPAWKRGVAALESQLPHSTDDAGLWRLKGGADAYAYFLNRYTTTHLTADQIHEIGLREVARIEKEMDGILRRLGRTEGSVKDRVEKLKQDLGYPKTEEGRVQIMADVNQILRDAQKRSDSLFDKVPKSPVVAQPFPRFREANAAANYNSPAPDGSRPGVFQIPLRPERMTKFGLRSLVYHETVPGHHFQIALQVENKDLPRFRQIGAFGGISALVEGWGLYAERLAAESGWYDGDPEGQVGELDSLLFRARRLVVDTGMHAQHWTRQQGIDYGIETSEVERYAVYPGQACSYMIGQLKIVELREKAKKALGDKFSLRAFHDVVLNTGTVPLDLLEQQVDAYIRANGGKL